MDRDALRWIVVVFGIVLVSPVLVYVLTGTVLGFLLPCTAGAGMETVTYGDSTLRVSCAAAGTALKFGVALWGSALLTFGAVVIGITDVLSRY
jgi:hypothetical protein